MKILLLIAVVFASTIDAQDRVYGGKQFGKQPGGFGGGIGKRPGGFGGNGKLPGGFGGAGGERPELGDIDISKICERSLSCPEGIEMPVCGTDGETYSSPCDLMKVKCEQEDTDLRIEHRGECGGEPVEGGRLQNQPSGAFGGQKPVGRPTFGGQRKTGRPAFGDRQRPTGRPNFGGRLSEGGRKPDFESLDIEQICERSKNCPEKFETPVCGTDGETYDNLCDLLSVKCEEENLELSVEHLGACGEEIERPYPGRFHNRSRPDPEQRKAICERREERCLNRSLEESVICGSNNVTYNNICEFKTAKCVDIFLTIAKKGECTEDQGDPMEYCVKCPVSPGHRGKPRRDEESTGEPLIESETETGRKGGFRGNSPNREEREGFGSRRSRAITRGTGGKRFGNGPEGDRQEGGTYGNRRKGGNLESGRQNGGKPEGSRRTGKPTGIQSGRPNRPEGDSDRLEGEGPAGRPRPHHGGKHHGGRPRPGRRPEHQQVCGTDDVTYESVCELKRTACILREFDLDVQSFGPCGTPTPAEEFPILP